MPAIGTAYPGSSSGSSLGYARITYGGGNNSSVLVNGASINLTHSTIRWGSYDALR